MASVLDSPAANTRSKADGPRLGKPKRMAVLGDASDAANKRSKVSRSATESKQEAAAERRWQAQERKKADVAQKKAERDAAMAKRKAEREAAAGAGRPGRTGSGDSVGAGRPGRTGSGDSVGAGRPGRTGSGDSASGRLGRTGSGEGRPNTARGGVKPRQPRGKAPAGLPERDPYDYKKRLEDMEGVLAKIVGANSSESEAGVTVESAPKGLEANVTALSEKQAAAAAQVAELTEKLKQVEESKAAALEGAEKAKEQELARLHAEAAAAAATHTVALAELQAKFESMTRDTEQLRTQLAGRESELAAMRSTVDTQAANLVAVKAQADATESALQAEKTAHAATTARAMGAEETVVQRDAMIVELEAKAKEDEKLRKKLHNTIQELKGNIRVFCRIRPGAEQSTASGEPDLFEVNGAKALAINDPNGRADMAGDIKNRSFDFAYDHVFGPDSRQDDVFEEISQLVQSALDGYKVCIFCYGQTGSGKTFTMQGPEGKEALSPGSELAGMIPRSCEQIFATAAELSECCGFTMEKRFVYCFLLNRRTNRAM
jgi:kinesin family protein C1